MTMIRRCVLPMAAILAVLTLAAGNLRADQIRVATEGTYRPFSYMTAGGELTGFDVELVQAICKAAGLDCVMVTMDNDAVMPALKDKKVDVLATGMSVTEKRKKVVAFTNPTRSSGKQFVSCTPDKFPDVSPAALKGHAIGTQTGTTSADFFQSEYGTADIRLYKSMDEAFQDLTAGRVELVLAQSAVGYDFTQSPAGAGCKFVGQRMESAKYFGEGVALALRPEDTKLRDALNDGLQKIIADGTYKALNAKYFPFPLN